MKNYTLDETWDNCLAMWKDISRRTLKPERNIGDEKKRWLKMHGFGFLWSNCFFCDYSVRMKGGCSSCPGRLVDKSFNCENSQYHYEHKPRAFYQELKRLNKIRLKRKKK